MGGGIIKCTLEPQARNCKITAVCIHCGFNMNEIRRRKTLPLEMGRDGLLRKYTGRTRPKQETQG